MKSRAERIARVEAALKREGLPCEIVRLEQDTSTAALAARVLGCEASQIVKSLVFMGSRGGEASPLLVLMGGSSRVDTAKLGACWGGDIEKATAVQVKDATGFEIGGIPPLGHAGRLTCFMDSRLMDCDRVWAAAGSTMAMFPIAPAQLRAATDAAVAELRAAA